MFLKFSPEIFLESLVKHTLSLNINCEKILKDHLNIVSHFLNQAELSPEFIAIEDKDQSYSYKNLNQLVRNYKAYYDDLGLHKGTKVIVLHQPCVELFAAILALLCKGCTVVFVEEWSNISDITAACQTIQCDYIITGWKGKCIRLFNKTLRKLILLNIHSVPKTENQYLSPVLMDDISPAIIRFSSGSSGASKAVVRTHATLNAQFNALKKHIKLANINRMCTNFPVVILLNLGLGNCTVLSENIVMSNLKKSKIGDLYNELLSKSVTHLAISPFLLINLAKYTLNQSLKQLKFSQILSGGSPIYPKYAEMLVSAFDCNNIDIPENIKFDLITSYLSCGYHYPISTYKELILKHSHKDTKLVFDLRNRKENFGVDEGIEIVHEFHRYGRKYAMCQIKFKE
jgi:acyl-CoA synthetase (AMP-forming)/AMP-acid ligase II